MDGKPATSSPVVSSPTNPKTAETDLFFPNLLTHDSHLDIIEIRDRSVVMWDKYTLETKFEAIQPGVKDPTTPQNELLAHGYWGINGTDEMPLPIGVQRALLD